MAVTALRNSLFAAALLVYAEAANACPLVDGLIDVTCDQQLKIVDTGDSIVYGVGDERFAGKGGYVRRLKPYYRRTRFINLGIPGITTKNLLRYFKKNLDGRSAARSSVTSKVTGADYVIIDIGRNDFWGRQPAARTVANIQRLVRYLRRRLKQLNGVEPVVAIASLIPTARAFQLPFIQEVNAGLLASDSFSYPVAIRFDTLPDSILSEDGLHPDSPGYTAMTGIIAPALGEAIQELAARKVTDADRDGIYDYFEVHRYGTDPEKRDTDGDGISDGEEIFGQSGS